MILQHDLGKKLKKSIKDRPIETTLASCVIGMTFAWIYISNLRLSKKLKKDKKAFKIGEHMDKFTKRGENKKYEEPELHDIIRAINALRQKPDDPIQLYKQQK